jgi:ribosome maturation factor RimP
MRGSREILQQARAAILPVLARCNYQLVDIEYVREPMGWVLRVFIDKEGGITIEECALVSGEIGDVLDAGSIVDGRYHLEISSPGLDRRVRDPIDFDRFAGRQVRIKSEIPLEGRRNFAGLLKGMDGDSVVVEIDGCEHRVPIDSIEKANLKHEWDE